MEKDVLHILHGKRAVELNSCGKVVDYMKQSSTSPFFMPAVEPFDVRSEGKI